MDYYDYIEAYSKDRLKPEDRARMEEAMASDSDLKEAVDHYDKIEPVLDLLIEEDLRARLEIIKAKHPDIESAGPTKRKPQSQIIPHGKWWSLAASVALLIGLFFTFYDSPSPTSEAQHLFAEHYKFQSPSVTRSTDTKPDETIPAGEALYYSAHERLKAGEGKAGRDLLQQISNPKNENRSDEIEWFIMMSYLEEGDLTTARQLLDAIIAQPDHLYTRGPDAQKLRDEMTK